MARIQLGIEGSWSGSQSKFATLIHSIQIGCQMMPVNLRFYQLSHVLSVYQSWHCPTDANCQEQLDHLLWISILSYLIPPVARNLDGEVSTCTSVGCRTGEEGLTSEDDVITEARNWPQSQVASPAAQPDSPGRRWGEGGARLAQILFWSFLDSSWKSFLKLLPKPQTTFFQVSRKSCRIVSSLGLKRFCSLV